ncbi:MAG: MEDS domain-containing protein [Acidimicrobiales bacterium]
MTVPIEAVRGAGVQGLQHLAWFYDDVEALADSLAELVDGERARGAEVLVSLPVRLSGPLFRRIDPSRVTSLEVGARYARPIDAMAALWRFTSDAIDRGVPCVHSIGEIEFTGADSDRAWHHYEAAVGHVLADVPLVATCLFDVERTPAVVRACAHVTHRQVVGVDPGAPALGELDESWLRPAEIAVPVRRPDLELAEVRAPALARHAVRALVPFGRRDLAERAVLVVSELVTNALVHASSPAGVRCWVDGTGLTLQVSDDGPGIADPYAGLRPPSLPERGAGLWLSNLESTALHVAAGRPHGTVVTARIE